MLLTFGNDPCLWTTDGKGLGRFKCPPPVEVTRLPDTPYVDENLKLPGDAALMGPDPWPAELGGLMVNALFYNGKK